MDNPSMRIGVNIMKGSKRWRTYVTRNKTATQLTAKGTPVATIVIARLFYKS